MLPMLHPMWCNHGMSHRVSSLFLILLPLFVGSSLNANSPRSALQSIVFPSIEFVEVPLHQVLEFLQVRSGELSGSPSNEVNFILKGDDELRDLPITLNLRSVSLGQALWFIGEIGELNFNFDQHAIIVSKPAEWRKVPAPRVAADRSVIEKVNRITIPRVEFTEIPLEDAVDFLRSFSIELDEAEPNPQRRGVNIVLLPNTGEKTVPEITLSLSDIPLAEVIRYTAQLADFEVRLENGAVLLAPKTPES